MLKQNIYKVKPGDNLWAIAKKLNISRDALIRANPKLKNQGYIYPGQILKTNLKKVLKNKHKKIVVKKGESLWTISRKHKITLKKLKKLNPKKNKTLKVGDILYVE